MKKGDIVQLKQEVHLLNTLLEGTPSYIEASNAPKELTVRETGRKPMCCTYIETVSFEEIIGVYSASSFNVLLEADEPDVAKLLEESKQMEKAWIGM